MCQPYIESATALSDINIVLIYTVKLVILAAIIFNVLVKTGGIMCLTDFNLTISLLVHV